MNSFALSVSKDQYFMSDSHSLLGLTVTSIEVCQERDFLLQIQHKIVCEYAENRLVCAWSKITWKLDCHSQYCPWKHASVILFSLG